MSLNFSETLVEWEIFSIIGSSIPVIFIFDYLSLFFLRLVRLISRSVLIFRISYMEGEKYFRRFIVIVLLFVRSIFLLVLSPNIIRLLLGWDGLGVTSYLLVIFYQRRKSYNAGIITAITNRLGDVGILICIGIMFSKGHWTFNFLRNRTVLDINIFLVIIIISACTKRAQVPFSA
jgi:NADH-ubiquinone oxidoreductase chain 5